MSQPHVDRVEALGPGPRVGCTWGGRSRPWGPPLNAGKRGGAAIICANAARWIAIDDANGTAWFVCGPHLPAIKRRKVRTSWT